MDSRPEATTQGGFNRVQDSPVRSFPPLLGERPSVLILGSMPGEASLARGQYYAHPRNQFWPLIFAVLGKPLPTEYDVRTRLAGRHGIALWDVLRECRREGSLDSRIHDERANDFASLFAHCPTLEAVYFNGGKAEQSFRKLVGFGQAGAERLQFFRLPSSSPAHTMPWGQKLEQWQHVARFTIREQPEGR